MQVFKLINLYLFRFMIWWIIINFLVSSKNEKVTNQRGWALAHKYYGSLFDDRHIASIM